MPVIGKMGRNRPRKGRKVRQGRKPKQEQVRLQFHGPNGRYVRIYLTEDMVKHLADMHDRVFGFIYTQLIDRETRGNFNPYSRIRIKFLRFEDLGIPGFILGIEPPTFDPKGHRLWRPPRSRQFCVQARRVDLGIKPGMPPTVCEALFEPKLPKSFAGGMLITLPDEYYPEPAQPKTRTRRKAGDPITLQEGAW